MMVVKRQEEVYVGSFPMERGEGIGTETECERKCLQAELASSTVPGFTYRYTSMVELQ